MSSVAAAGDLVAIVDLEFIRATDKPAAVMCFGDRDEDCHVWATLNVYIVEWGEKREMFCFGRRQDDTERFELRKGGEDSLTCYDAP